MGLVIYLVIARQRRELDLVVDMLSLGFRAMGYLHKEGIAEVAHSQGQ